MPRAGQPSLVGSLSIDLERGHVRLQDGVVSPGGEIISGLLQAYSLHFPAFGPMTVRFAGADVYLRTKDGNLIEAALIDGETSLFRVRFSQNGPRAAFYRTGTSSFKFVREPGGAQTQELRYTILQGSLELDASRFNSNGRAIDATVFIRRAAGSIRIEFYEGRMFLAFAASHVEQIDWFEKTGHFATLVLPNLRESGLAIDVAFVAP